MIAPQHAKAKKERRSGFAAAPFDLPYRVELWDESRERIERIVARVHSETWRALSSHPPANSIPAAI